MKNNKVNDIGMSLLAINTMMYVDLIILSYKNNLLLELILAGILSTIYLVIMYILFEIRNRINYKGITRSWAKWAKRISWVLVFISIVVCLNCQHKFLQSIFSKSVTAVIANIIALLPLVITFVKLGKGNLLKDDIRVSINPSNYRYISGNVFLNVDETALITIINKSNNTKSFHFLGLAKLADFEIIMDQEDAWIDKIVSFSNVNTSFKVNSHSFCKTFRINFKSLKEKLVRTDIFNKNEKSGILFVFSDEENNIYTGSCYVNTTRKNLSKD